MEPEFFTAEMLAPQLQTIGRAECCFLVKPWEKGLRKWWISMDFFNSLRELADLGNLTPFATKSRTHYWRARLAGILLVWSWRSTKSQSVVGWKVDTKGSNNSNSSDIWGFLKSSGVPSRHHGFQYVSLLAVMVTYDSMIWKTPVTWKTSGPVVEAINSWSLAKLQKVGAGVSIGPGPFWDVSM
jgi:hypothetical protein